MANLPRPLPVPPPTPAPALSVDAINAATAQATALVPGTPAWVAAQK